MCCCILYERTQEHKSSLFPNSRMRAKSLPSPCSRLPCASKYLPSVAAPPARRECNLLSWVFPELSGHGERTSGDGAARDVARRRWRTLHTSLQRRSTGASTSAYSLEASRPSPEHIQDQENIVIVANANKLKSIESNGALPHKTASVIDGMIELEWSGVASDIVEAPL